MQDTIYLKDWHYVRKYVDNAFCRLFAQQDFLTCHGELPLQKAQLSRMFIKPIPLFISRHHSYYEHTNEIIYVFPDVFLFLTIFKCNKSIFYANLLVGNINDPSALHLFLTAISSLINACFWRSEREYGFAPALPRE